MMKFLVFFVALTGGFSGYAFAEGAGSPPGIPYSAIGTTVAPLVSGVVPYANLPAATSNTPGVVSLSAISGTAPIQSVGSALSLSGTTVNLPLVNTSGAGIYNNITVDAYGRITAIRTLTGSDITGALGYTPPQIGTTSGSARDAALAISAESNAQTTANAAQATANAALVKSNNLSDLTNNVAARSNLFGFAVTLGGAFTTSGANALTLTTTGSTNVTLPTSGTLLNSTSVYLTTDSSAGTYTATTDSYLCVNKATAAANTVTLPASPTAGRIIEVKDCAGNSATYPITVSPSSGTIDGASSVVINTNYEALHFIYNGTQWGIW